MLSNQITTYILARGSNTVLSSNKKQYHNNTSSSSSSSSWIFIITITTSCKAFPEHEFLTVLKFFQTWPLDFLISQGSAVRLLVFLTSPSIHSAFGRKVPTFEDGHIFIEAFFNMTASFPTLQWFGNPKMTASFDNTWMSSKFHQSHPTNNQTNNKQNKTPTTKIHKHGS